MNINSVIIAELYHPRWNIELFFKWLKQLVKINKFWGESENAVRIQIYAAITTYCMMAIVQKKMRIKRSIYEMLQITSISLTDTTVLKELFELPNHNIVKERNGSEEPTLFDCFIAHNFLWTAMFLDKESIYVEKLLGITVQILFRHNSLNRIDGIQDQKLATYRGIEYYSMKGDGKTGSLRVHPKTIRHNHLR